MTVHPAANLADVRIVFTPLELTAVLLVTGTVMLIAGVLVCRQLEVTVVRRRPPGDPGWLREDDGPDPDDPLLTAEWPLAPEDVVPSAGTSRARWPLATHAAGRRPGRHRLRRDQIHYRPAGVV